jgi:class 3 adenylate cyclase
MISENQMPERFRKVIDDQITIYNQGRSITQRNEIPDTSQIPIENSSHWLRIPQVICVFVDMLGSTKLSAENHDNSTAGAYQLFTGTAVRLFHEFEAPYIDVRGDGVFALFNSNQPYRALAAAVSFKTFAREVFVPLVREKTQVEVGCHIGIDQKTVLVRKLGLKHHDERTDRQNEVWAGKPINMASKLAARSQDDELFASDRFFEKIQNDLVLLSCGCPEGEKSSLWEEVDVSDVGLFDFDSAWVLRSCWCSTHGKEYCESILALD